MLTEHIELPDVNSIYDVYVSRRGSDFAVMVWPDGSMPRPLQGFPTRDEAYAFRDELHTRLTMLFILSGA